MLKETGNFQVLEYKSYIVLKIKGINYLLLILPLVLLSTNSLWCQSSVITHGPILGRLTDQSVGVWARTSTPSELIVRYGESPDALFSGLAGGSTSLDHDNTGWVELTNLQPNSEYYYRIETPSYSAPVASFYTLPNNHQYQNDELNPEGLFNFRFEFACGNNQNKVQGSGPELPAFKTMLENLYGKVHFSIQNGDWLYEESRGFSPDQWLEQQAIPEDKLPDIVKIAPTITGAWENYKVYLSRGINMARYHQYVPTFFTFDDHEILNDVWGAGSPGLRDRRAVFRDIGEQAWYDYLGWSNPILFTQDIVFGQTELQGEDDVLYDPNASFSSIDLEQISNLHVHWGDLTAGVNDNALDYVGGHPSAGVYEVIKVLDDHRLQISPEPKASGNVSYSIGRRSYFNKQINNCEFFFLDTRSHRQMHDTKEPDKPGLSILGNEQKQWLIEGVKKSEADFIFVISSVNFMVPHVGGGKVRTSNKDDAWTVFLDERESLIESWDELNKPVLVLTGDLHNSFAIQITDNVWEFASGPHNSNNHYYTDEGNRPATGKFQYGPRACDIRWSTYYRDDIPRSQLANPVYCVVQVNNVFNNAMNMGEQRWVAFERPQVIVQYYDGRNGDLLYAEAITAKN